MADKSSIVSKTALFFSYNFVYCISQSKKYHITKQFATKETRLVPCFKNLLF